MKKLTNNQKKFMIPVFAFLLVGLATAGIVTYISNQAEVGVNVDKPLEISLNSVDYNGQGSVSLNSSSNEVQASIFGGESISTTGEFENHANATIENVSVQIAVHGATNESEIENISHEDQNGSYTLYDPTDPNVGCFVNGTAYAYAGSEMDIAPLYDSPESNTTTTFDQSAAGNYSTHVAFIDNAQNPEKC